MNDTTLFYTFSTISQTLAGAFGFLLAVVLYQMQHLTEEMRDALKQVWNNRQRLSLDDLRRAESEHGWSEVISVLKNHPVPQSVEEPYRQAAHTNETIISKNYEKLCCIRRGLAIALCLTGLTIGLALLFLSLTPYIILIFWLAPLCLYLTLALAILSIGSYLPLVWIIVR